jgi:predicted  nucleic acid-binding Zn-ribbon protein
MDKTGKSKWQVRVAAVLIFVLGFAAGALALNVYQRWRSDDRTRRQAYERLVDRLQLNSDQKTQVQQIIGETRQQLQALRKDSDPRVVQIRQQTDERLQKVLTPEQWKQFEQMRDEIRSRGRRGN